MDSCGNVQTDTIVITNNAPINLDIGPDLIICEGDSVVFAVPGFETYQWWPPNGLSCTDCDTPIVSPDNSTTYSLVVQTADGCVAVDSIHITVITPGEVLEDSLTLCEGDTIFLDGNPVWQPGTYSQTFTSGTCTFEQIVYVSVENVVLTQETLELCTGDSIQLFGNWVTDAGLYNGTFSGFNGCDSTHLVDVEMLPVFFTSETMEICENDTASIFGVPQNTPGDYTMTFPAQNGCDSTHQITLEVMDTMLLQETEIICFGDSIFIFDQFEHQAGTYSLTTPLANDCDFTHIITLEVLDPLQVEFQMVPACENDATGEITATVSGGLPPYQFTWSGTNQNTSAIDGLQPGPYMLTVTDAHNCTIATSVTLTTVSIATVELITTPVTCFGDRDGTVTIFSTFDHLQFSLEGIIFQPEPLFENLPAGQYDLHVLDENDCLSILNFTITEPPELIVNLPDDLTLSLGDSVRVRSLINSTDSLAYQWSPTDNLSCTTCPEPFANPLFTALYGLTVTNENDCTASDEILITIEKTCEVFIPNAFSPNSDGINDLFYIQSSKDIREIRYFRIFDRWGEQVFGAENFPPNHPGYGWNGFFKGERMNAGVFVYVAEVECLDGHIELVAGDVALLR